LSATAGVLGGHGGHGGTPGDRVPGGGAFLAPLVVRLAVEYGVDPEVVGRLGATVLESFAGARVQAFVPVLVEKRLRETLRRGQRRRPRSAPG
jgi:hypothetical protein